MQKDLKETEPTCQDCRFHTNKPSACTENGHTKYVGRKSPICLKFCKK